MPFISLPSKPKAPLYYELFNALSAGPVIVFINGLGLPAASWKPTVSLLEPANSPMLIYDRFGQGETISRDPLDELPDKEEGYGHDLADAARDLGELLGVLGLSGSKASRSADGAVSTTATEKSLILVAASIGAHIARLHTTAHPEHVSGLLILDSNVSNSELTDSWPDPSSPSFDCKDVIADDCTLEQYRSTRAKLSAMFGSAAKNSEALDRRNVKRLLPRPDQPKLTGVHGKGVWLTVVGHDPLAFEMEGLKSGTPRSLTRRFTQPTWHEYNVGLTRLSSPERTAGVVFAQGCGHFIQRDDPAFVAEQVRGLLERIKGR